MLIGEDGIVRCKDAKIGTKVYIEENWYEVVDRVLIEQRVNEGSDLTLSCVSNVTDMSLLMLGSNFNQPIGNWDVSSVTNMLELFAFTSFNQSIENWNVSNVTNMDNMFLRSPFNQDIGGWNVSNVTSMYAMFDDASEFNQDIGYWDVSNVTNMDNMFKNATNFNQDLSKWCITKITSEPTLFSKGSNLKDDNKPRWGTCTFKPIPGPIILLTPYNYSIDIGKMTTFSWEKQPKITNYQLQIFEEQENSMITKQVDTTNINLNSLKSNKKYYWKVRGVNGNENITGEWSDTWSFITEKFRLGTPLLSTPVNETINVGTLTEFTWDKVEFSTAYHLQISTDNQFKSIVFDSSQIASTMLTLSEPLMENATHFWRLRSISNSDYVNSVWSDTLKFTTGIRSSNENEIDQTNFFFPKIILIHLIRKRLFSTTYQSHLTSLLRSSIV